MYNSEHYSSYTNKKYLPLSENICLACHKQIEKNGLFPVCYTCRYDDTKTMNEYQITRNYFLKSDEVRKGAQEKEIRWFDTRYYNYKYQSHNFNGYYAKYFVEDVEKYGTKIMKDLPNNDIRKCKFLSKMSEVEKNKKFQKEKEKRREALKQNVRILALKLILPHYSDEIKYILQTLDHPQIHDIIEFNASKLDFKIMPLSMLILDKIESLVDKKRAEEIRRRDIDSLLKQKFSDNKQKVYLAQNYYEYSSYINGNTYFNLNEVVNILVQKVNVISDKEVRQKSLDEIINNLIPKDYQEMAKGCAEYNKFIYSGDMDNFDEIKNKILKYIEDEMLMKTILANRRERLMEYIKKELPKKYQSDALETCEAKFYLEYGKNIWDYILDDDYMEGLEEEEDELELEEEKLFKKGVSIYENYKKIGFKNFTIDDDIGDDDINEIFKLIKIKMKKN